MIKKAIIITLAAMLGACSDSDDASRVGNASTSKKPSEYQTKPVLDSIQNAAEDTIPHAEGALSDELIAEEQALVDEIETIIEDEPEDLKDQAQTKITIQPGVEDGVAWQAPEEVAYRTAEMVIVTPDGERIKRKFVAGQPIALNESLPDGLYKWESVVTPEIDPYVMEEMRSARESGDLQAQQEMMKKFRAQGALPSKEKIKENRQSGAFVVRDGIATPTTTESSGPDERG